MKLTGTLLYGIGLSESYTSKGNEKSTQRGRAVQNGTSSLCLWELHAPSNPMGDFRQLLPGKRERRGFAVWIKRIGKIGFHIKGETGAKESAEDYPFTTEKSS